MKKTSILVPVILLLLLLLPPQILRSTGSHQVMVAAMEMELSSEESRRLLLWGARETKYISYQVLKGDVVPCGRPGVPYYNCLAFPSASPYSRGCETIRDCRGGTTSP